MAFETEHELDELQALLDRSEAAAGAHLASIFTKGWTLTARELVALLSGMQIIDLATVTAAGVPPGAPGDGHFLHGRWTFGTAPNAARAFHLAARPAVSAAHTRGEGLCVITHGHAERVDMAGPAGQELLAYLRTVYPGY